MSRTPPPPSAASLTFASGTTIPSQLSSYDDLQSVVDRLLGGHKEALEARMKMTIDNDGVLSDTYTMFGKAMRKMQNAEFAALGKEQTSTYSERNIDSALPATGEIDSRCQCTQCGQKYDALMSDDLSKLPEWTSRDLTGTLRRLYFDDGFLETVPPIEGAQTMLSLTNALARQCMLTRRQQVLRGSTETHVRETLLPGTHIDPGDFPVYLSGHATLAPESGGGFEKSAYLDGRCDGHGEPRPAGARGEPTDVFLDDSVEQVLAAQDFAEGCARPVLFGSTARNTGARVAKMLKKFDGPRATDMTDVLPIVFDQWKLSKKDAIVSAGRISADELGRLGMRAAWAAGSTAGSGSRAMTLTLSLQPRRKRGASD